jgi:catechol 2,3-dioxygenase-like lactoylglutathione lyase family enzyme
MPRLPVADLERSVAFYSGRLGFQVGSVWPEQAPTFAILYRDEVCVQLIVVDAPDIEHVGHATLSFDVDDVKGLHDALAGHVAIEWGPEVYWYGRREFAVKDPDGYLLILSEQTDEPPTCPEEDR